MPNQARDRYLEFMDTIKVFFDLLSLLDHSTILIDYLIILIWPYLK
jgi:hypothetical protein